MPKPQGRMQSRRAASKEALKQMHRLIGDEQKNDNDSDDDVIEVDVQPPKKKYKVSHKKDGNDRDVIVLKSVQNVDDVLLDMDVTIEPLSSVQQKHLDVLRQESKEMAEQIKALSLFEKTEIIYNGKYTTAYEITEHLQAVMTNNTVLNLPKSAQPIVLQQPNTTVGNTNSTQSYQLVMDPRLGVIVGAMTGTNSTSAPPALQLLQPNVNLKTTAVPSSTTTTTAASPAAPEPVKRRSTILRQVPSSAVSPMHKAALQQKSSSIKKVVAGSNSTQIKTILGKKIMPKGLKPIMPLKGRPPSGVLSQVNLRPNETNVEGGLSVNQASSIDLTSDDGRSTADSKEVSFNKLQGTTYPSLVVVARPHLRVKDLTADRAKLDLKVKGVLMHPPTKFTEWLIQQGLVRSEQSCSYHPGKQLKLGMYSDASKFPYSGGYVWISECCPKRFVSVFSGSLFEGSQHPPMSILKLIYHWCCQTIVQNVTQWVKVDNLYVKNMYTWLRAICSVAIQTHNKTLGGYGIKVQIGVISLGTTSQDGHKREVKVEVLGILETSSRHIILRAIEPLPEGERNYKKRFAKILQPVFHWVHPGSHIITDLTVDKATLNQMGFTYVTQSTSLDYNQSNRTIMEYLRRIVPRMFQNTLSLLSRPIIQQFLDELVWREWYGFSVLECFDNMLVHLSEQTRHSTAQSLITRLNKVAAEPFRDWSINSSGSGQTSLDVAPKKYTRVKKPVAAPVPVGPASAIEKPPKSPVLVKQGAPVKPATSAKQATPAKQPAPAKQPTPSSTSQEIVKAGKSYDMSEQMVPLENYYYGSISQFFPPKVKVVLNIRCPFCTMNFNSNIFLMNHLFKHAHNISSDAQLCKYCLTIVPDAEDLLKHISSAHPDETKFNCGFVCLICEQQFRNPFILGKHMSQRHCPSELPYSCGTCNFRCSNHKQAIDHFYQQHDGGTTIQCPFCLKSTTINSGGRNITQNMNFFIQHLQKHQKKHTAKKCPKCNLWFVQKEFLKYHVAKMHVSQRGKTGLVPSFAPRNGVMVPKSYKDKCPDSDIVINFQTLRLIVSKHLNCKECTNPLNVSKHFTSFQNCQQNDCKYSTCCTYAMQAHNHKCKNYTMREPGARLPSRMYCICGFNSTFGNTMAKHLATCERKSAYPSAASAKSATVTHCMLDVLGLVRKPGEASSTRTEQSGFIPLDEASFSGTTLTKSTVAPLKPIILRSRKKQSETDASEEGVSVEGAAIKNEVETEDVALMDDVTDVDTRMEEDRPVSSEKESVSNVDEDSKDGIVNKDSEKTDGESKTSEDDENLDKKNDEDTVSGNEDEKSDKTETVSEIENEEQNTKTDEKDNEKIVASPEVLPLGTDAIDVNKEESAESAKNMKTD